MNKKNDLLEAVEGWDKIGNTINIERVLYFALGVVVTITFMEFTEEPKNHERLEYLYLALMGMGVALAARFVITLGTIGKNRDSAVRKLNMLAAAGTRAANSKRRGKQSKGLFGKVKSSSSKKPWMQGKA